jgi:phage gp29-like protein
VVVAPQAERAPEAVSEGDAAPELIADKLAEAAAPAVEKMLTQLEAMIEAATSLEEFREMLLSAFPKVDSGPLAKIMAQAMTVAEGTGRIDVEAEGA